MTKTTSAIAVLLAGAFLLTGCAKDDGPSPTSLVSPQSSDDKPMTDLKSEQALGITGMEPVTDRQIRIHFTAGDPDCYGTRAAVKESDSEVLIGAVTGVKANAPQLCKQIGRQATILVTLDKPIGNRQLKKWDEPTPLHQ